MASSRPAPKRCYYDVLEVEREDIVLAEVDPKRMDNVHVQIVSRVKTSDGEVGTGTANHVFSAGFRMTW